MGKGRRTNNHNDVMISDLVGICTGQVGSHLVIFPLIEVRGSNSSLLAVRILLPTRCPKTSISSQKEVLGLWKQNGLVESRLG